MYFVIYTLSGNLFYYFLISTLHLSHYTFLTLTLSLSLCFIFVNICDTTFPNLTYLTLFSTFLAADEFVVETVVSSSEFMVDDTSARNFNDKTFGSSVVLKSPIELHNAYFGAGVLAAAVFIVAVVVSISVYIRLYIAYFNISSLSLFSHTNDIKYTSNLFVNTNYIGIYISCKIVCVLWAHLNQNYTILCEFLKIITNTKASSSTYL